MITTIEELRQATKAACSDLEKQIRSLKYDLHRAGREIDALRSELDLVEPRIAALEIEVF